MKTKVCIHGHFYQPPRENPWLGVVEKEESASPYHDWNERIHEECYSQNAWSRILNSEKKISLLLNNYASMSFNIGPTLFNWIEKKDPETYEAILQADRDAMQKFSGHGSAIAQVYNHIIMPLANRRDKQTQVEWGIQDFIYRFKRYPEGIWLAETAVDIETLEVLAENEIQFTILAPHQAGKILQQGEWKITESHQIDTGKAWLCRLPSGKKIHLFFYNGGLSHAVGFGKLLNDGKAFADRLIQSGSSGLVNIAVDGETFGHHHRFGDMALAYCISQINTSSEADLTVYGEFLEQCSQIQEVEIRENTSWSCAHGIERWRSHCGCNSGKQPDWNQLWRTPLRDSLDWLRDEINLHIDNLGIENFWQARNRYISVILSGKDEKEISRFVESLQGNFSTSQLVSLFELQKYMMMMYTSCGWFFDDIAGLETRLVLRFAIRAIQIAEPLLGISIEQQFVARLSAAKSNMPDFVNGSDLLEQQIIPEKSDLLRVNAYFAILLLFENSLDTVEKFHFAILDYHSLRKEQGGRIYLSGKMKIRDLTTREISSVVFCVSSDDSYDVWVYLQEQPKEASDYAAILEQLPQTNSSGYLEKKFRYKYSIQHLFRDKQYEITCRILQKAVTELEQTQNRIFAKNYRTIQYFYRSRLTIPKPLLDVIENTMTEKIVSIFREEKVNVLRLKKHLARAKKFMVVLNQEAIEIEASKKIHSMLREIANGMDNDFQTILHILGILSESSLELDVYKVQNLYYKIWKKNIPFAANENQTGDLPEEFHEIGRMLRMAVD